MVFSYVIGNEMTNVRSKIVNWLGTQQQWVQDAAVKILKNEVITEVSIHEYSEVVLGKGSDTYKVDFEFFTKSSISTKDIKIKSLGNIKGIDNLNPRMPIEFTNGLNVIYGNNGTGKSGYTRILKSLCGSLGSPILRGNIYDDKPISQSVDVIINIDGNEELITWTPELGAIETLKDVIVFDSEVSRVYIDKANETSYVPYELSLFKELIEVFSRVKLHLESEKSLLKSTLPILRSDFDKTEVVSKIKNLTSKTKVSELDTYFVFTAKDQERHDTIKTLLANDPANLIAQEKSVKVQLDNIISGIESAATKLSLENQDKLKQQHNDYISNKEAFETSATAFKDKSKLTSIGSETWLKMWTAAATFSTVELSHGQKSKLSENEICVLCHQDLTFDAKERIQCFENYVASKLKGSMSSALKIYTNNVLSLPKSFNEEALRTQLLAAKLDESVWLQPMALFWGDIESTVKTKHDSPLKPNAPIMPHTALIQALKDIVKAVDQKIEELTKEKVQFDRSKLESEDLELQAKRWAVGYLTEIKFELSTLNLKVSYNKGIKKVSSSAVTKKSGEFSKEIITDDYIKRFNFELDKLGADNISVELVKSPGDKGKIKHQIKLKTTNTKGKKESPLNILSEGEQRVVGIAACLADISRIPHESAIIFDDPISSLDLDWEEKTARRLIELSQVRQVIVLTHRISLLGALTADNAVNSIHIRKEHWGCGEHGKIPLFAKKPINALSLIKSERIPQAKKMLETSGYEIYEMYAKALCSEIRILIERVVEVEFLVGIVQRHSRKVQTLNKVMHLAKINSSDCNIIDEAMTTFSMFEHSQPIETPVMTPTPEFLDAEVEKILIWHKEFKTRKVAVTA